MLYFKVNGKYLQHFSLESTLEVFVPLVLTESFSIIGWPTGTQKS